MKPVVLFQTCDGQTHSTEEDAKRYAENRYNDTLLILVSNIHGLSQTGHAEMRRRINNELEEWEGAFRELRRLKDDIQEEEE